MRAGVPDEVGERGGVRSVRPARVHLGLTAGDEGEPALGVDRHAALGGLPGDRVGVRAARRVADRHGAADDARIQIMLSKICYIFII